MALVVQAQESSSLPTLEDAARRAIMSESGGGRAVKIGW